MLTDSLNRHRGKGQQTVRVEHVHVHDGGRAIVGTVGQGGGDEQRNLGQPQAQLAYAPEPAMRSTDAEGEPCQAPAVNGSGAAGCMAVPRAAVRRRASGTAVIGTVPARASGSC